jgi:hypothetical protein
MISRTKEFKHLETVYKLKGSEMELKIAQLQLRLMATMTVLVKAPEQIHHTNNILNLAR